MDLSKFQQEFLAYKEAQNLTKEPKNLYEPIRYILSLGGKKIRPVLTLMAASLFSDEYKKALPAAYAVEMFHNFTLVHDDIMDDAPLRRGKETVHEKWDINTGILSGDAMLILAYQYFENYPPVIFQKLAKLFSKTAIEVCDGQQLDVDFETRNDVSIEEYIQMISLKTSVLIGAALKMGAIVCESTEKDADILYDFGLNLGIAFQLQDDYLDTYGNPETFGKQVGGDIIENKKTYLYLKALELASKEDAELLNKFYQSKLEDSDEKITLVKKVFDKYQVPTYMKAQIINYSKKAFALLDDINISDKAKTGLLAFGKALMTRNV
ncbi:(2E,6E)-farnesyl diphosphate synthase [Polaribacter huanghezhanensis]|uniref:polyprenyl synthetase family protein n=1 Tax=Polaribacter huanghezhanensis TaxID=1354726 RepID=UPI002649C0BF|nr:polyprenyl synthetase family protein [Polaribacter huanghezhanensis]WKD85682.1 (2E,6E)-farnesyl diphosphate synthase [Polaribacter huanghezhanensis]